MDRQKKTALPQCDCREYGGGVRGLARITGWQLKFWRDISVARSFSLRSMRSKFQAGLTSLQQWRWKRNPNNSRVSVCLGEIARDREPLKGPMHKILFAVIRPGLC